MHKAGFVNIVGNPNVGKSTLMNQLIGERISIATFKAQTTRHRIMGIVNTDDAQIVFSDTPGVLKPNYKLQESMLAFSESALQDADVLLYVTDVVENPEKNMDFLDKVKKMTIPVLLLINKIDMSEQKQLGDIVEKWHALLPNAEILPISAQNKFGTDILMKRIQELLPPSPPYFDKDQLTDKPARFFVSESLPSQPSNMGANSVSSSSSAPMAGQPKATALKPSILSPSNSVAVNSSVSAPAFFAPSTTAWAMDSVLPVLLQ